MDDTTRTNHRRAWDLIPWVVTGTASADEAALVEEHLARCADCRAEFAFHERLRAGLQDALPPHPAEPAWARMQARLDRFDGASEPSAAVPARAPRRSRWLVGLAAAVAAQSIALGVLAGLWLGRDAPYQTLASAAAAPPDAAVRLVPAPTLALGELRALLDRHQLRIVQSSGDGAILGLVPQPAHPFAIGDVITALRSEPGVLLAEPIASPGRAR